METTHKKTTILPQEHSCNPIDSVYPGDVMELLRQLPDESVDLVLADPDYNVGIKYNGNSYTTRFNEYIEWYINLTREMTRILKPDGNIYLINYAKQNAYLRVHFLDDACYQVLDYAWVYKTNTGHSPNHLTTAHRSILHGRKTRYSRFYKEQIAVPYQNPGDKRIKARIEAGSPGRMPYSWVEINQVKNVSMEKTVHACQIPQQLSELLVLSCTKPGDTVFVPFGGSGAELEVCKRLGRHFISAEIDPVYQQLIEERLAAGGILPHHRLK